jgi:MerR family transcriptional regulator, copper efflux regulator
VTDGYRWTERWPGPGRKLSFLAFALDFKRLRYVTLSSMAAITIQDVSRRSGLSEPTLRYYEEVGLIGPIARDPGSGHRRYCDEDLDTLQALACLRAMGVGIEDMRTYQANRALGHAAAAEQRDLLLRHAERIEAEIATLLVHLDYLRAKAALWDARDRGDTVAEAAASQRVKDVAPRLKAVLR